MAIDISFRKTRSKGADTAVIFVNKDKDLGKSGKKLDSDTGGFVRHVLSKDPKFTGKAGEFKVLALPAGAGYRQLILAGIGKAEDLQSVKAEEAGGKLLPVLEGTAAVDVDILADESGDYLPHYAYGLNLRAYKFTKYKTKKPEKQKQKEKTKDLESISFITSIADAHTKHYKSLANIAEGVYFARDLVNEPPNQLFPDTFARRLDKTLSPLGVEVEILDEKKMAKLGMGAALAVGQGSDHPPRMVVMRWNNAKSGKPVALVGKGITFDTGGISLKPGAGMEEMKMDMGGAAAVAGTMMALALNKTKANVVAIAGLAENMPSGRAYRPSDIVTSYAGKTIEVLNTDAEGRLVLADALSYIQDKYKPRLIIDLATLTGAMLVALGHEYCGVFANDDKLWSQMETAGKDTGEKIWRMPLDEVWKKEMTGSITDLQNLAKSGRNAGSCTAAGFLEHFIEDKQIWAHMDIAGTAWVKSDKPTVPKYGTGFGVRLLHAFVQDNYG